MPDVQQPSLSYLSEVVLPDSCPASIPKDEGAGYEFSRDIHVTLRYIRRG